MTQMKIYLPKKIEGYMEACEAKSGTREWFQDAFYAVAQCAIDNGEYIADEARGALSNGIEEDMVEEVVEQMKKEAGLDSLC